MRVIVWPGFWSPDDVLDNPDYLFLFGDNCLGVGMAGQACIRGLKNAYGIPTKFAPGMREQDFFTDLRYQECCTIIAEAIENIPTGYLAYVVSESGLGTGLAQLPTKAPKVYAYLEDAMTEFERNL